MLALLVTLYFAPTKATTQDATALVAEQARLTVRYDKGAVTILKVERQPLGSPVRMPRWRGRFEARAVAGDKTLDFVRFDFPLMAAAEAPDDVTEEARVLGKKIREHVTATTIVKAPLPAGANAIAIYDNVTRKSTTVELPAAATAAPPSGSRPAAGATGNTRK
jgi:hypothetical protein